MSNPFIKGLEREFRRKAICFNGKTMNGVTYKDCEYIAQSRGYMLHNPDMPSGFTTPLYCFPCKEGNLYAFNECGDYCCMVKNSRKSEAYFTNENIDNYVINWDYIESLKVLEKLQKMDQTKISYEDLNKLEELKEVINCCNCGYSGNYRGYTWFVLTLVEGEEINLYCKVNI